MMKKFSTAQKIIFILVAYNAVVALLIMTRLFSPTSHLCVAFGAEFIVRPDGYKGLKDHYGFEFDSRPRQMVDGMLYKSLATGTVDVINAFSTDGRIPAYNLVCLEDDKNFFPPYYAAPLIRSETLEKYPQLRGVLNKLSGKMTNEQMRQLNYQVDEEGKKAKKVALDFLLDQKIISQKPEAKKFSSGSVVVGSKEFTEQEILGELIVQLIQAETNLKVEKKLKLGGTIICFNALKAGDVDLYPEYTGTGLVNILKEDVVNDPQEVYEIVKRRFEEKFDLLWLGPLGFNNTYTLTVREKFADRYNLDTISDLSQFVKSGAE
jgi:osmoprotectant transport system permease protein